MEILIVIFLLLLLGTSIFLLYKVLKWIVAKKVRAIGALSILSATIISVTMYQLFFVKMEFIQSNVYPNLYLVKNEIKDRDSLHAIIKSRVIEMIDKNLINNQKVYTANTHEAPYAVLAFYSYSKSSRLSVFQDYGTAYFIDHEEDLSGFSVEDLGMYHNEKLATFNIRPNKKGTTQHYGLLEYYENGYVVKTDTVALQKKIDLK